MQRYLREKQQEARDIEKHKAKKLLEWVVELDEMYLRCKRIRAYLILVGILGVVFLSCGSMAGIKILLITGLGLETASVVVRWGTRIVEYYITLVGIGEDAAGFTEISKAVENLRSKAKWLLTLKDAGEIIYLCYVAKELKLIDEQQLSLILKSYIGYITKWIIEDEKSPLATTTQMTSNIDGNMTRKVLGGKFDGEVVIGIGIIFLVINTVELLLTKRDLNNNQSSNAAKSLIAKADEINERISRT